MPLYVDGFVIPIQKRKVAAYIRMAKAASKIWRDYGALEYRECIGDDLHAKFGLPFPKGIKVKPGETVVFSWITYPSRAHRDRVNAKIMSDPRLQRLMRQPPPFDAKRMMVGGFKAVAGWPPR